jgi:flavin-dependent dehydrogenase
MVDGRPAIRLGLAKLMKDRGDASKLTDLFVAKLVLKKIIMVTAEAPSYVFGSLIPIGGALKKTYKNNTMLLGNAAGFCGAFAADGIKGAVIAGKEAAPLIARHLNGDAQALGEFSKAVNRHGWLMDYYRRQLRYRWAWDMMKRDRTFTALWQVIEKEKESFLHQFCDSKDKRRSLAWTVIKLNNLPRLIKFAFFLALDAVAGRKEAIK